ncbi:UNVERIFIED_CONTAM: hypothetical protein GTU68_060554 [Idotea baltica]|nr:hypothetical protein [Idotea baltica]
MGNHQGRICHFFSRVFGHVDNCILWSAF